MLTRTAIDNIIPILRKDARRALRMRVPGFPKPYYCSFLLRDINWFNTWAAGGSTYRRRSDRTRNVFCDLRVGSYNYDQTTEGGLTDNDEDQESGSHLSAPIDDRAYQGLRLTLWRLSEAKFREALGDYSRKVAARISTVDPARQFPSFTKLRPISAVSYTRPERVDEDKWVRFCKHASRWTSELAILSASWVDFDVTQETRIFVSTENRIIVQHKQIFSLVATLRKLTAEGSQIDEEVVLNCATQRELPDFRAFKKLVMEKYDILQDLLKARNIHAFTGPVLLYPGPAGLLFHEAIGHRLEGSRLLASGEGQTFKGQEGQKILSLPLTIRDNPLMKKYNSTLCVGAYDFDEEGTPAQDAILVEDGVLKGFLSTRAAYLRKGFRPNGHARNGKHQRPISRMAVSIIEGKEPCSMERLKELLIREIKKQKKPFGLIIYETCGGETETSTYDFQAFSGEISYAKILYPDGREVCVRGIDFVGTPLQALSNIIAVGDELEVANGYCGAESGFIPVTTISPAILLSTLELQAKGEELVTPYLLPKPRL